MKLTRLKSYSLSLFFLVIILFPFSGITAKTAGIKPQRTTCDYRINPSVLDNLHPRLSWINVLTDSLARGEKQTAWQVKGGVFTKNSAQ